MLRVLSAALRGTARAVTIAPVKSAECRIPSIFTKSAVPTVGFESQARYFSLLSSTSLNRQTVTSNACGRLLGPSTSPNILTTEFQVAKVPVRTLIKYTRYSGKRKTVRTVLKRFYRLDWGMWIRTKAGRHKRLWRKSAQRKRRLRRHVFTTASQSHLLDTLVSKYWRRPKYYVDDPYNPYHKRESYPLTRTKPREA